MFSLLPASTRILPSLPRNRRFIPTLGRRSSSHRGKAGHLSSRCPDPVRCRLCGGEGHVSRLCTTPDPTHVRPKSWRRNGALSRELPEPCKCHLCGGNGHIATKCADPNVVPLTWYVHLKYYGVGGETGHIVSRCPNPVKCHHCGGDGHIAAECTDPNVGRPTWCVNKFVPPHSQCGEIGHLVASCPKPVRCRLCGGEGHISDECTDPNVVRPTWCYDDVGGETGHIGSRCPNPVKCRRCGGDGHIAACPDPNVGRPWSHVEVDASTSKISYKRLKTRE
ncbi:hypothetical protein B0H11DRAFT_2122762 [Mycena galericulata]|nr:hypothetical protein B0H11DRAFT_2122762 [Mycena galericulata]